MTKVFLSFYLLFAGFSVSAQSKATASVSVLLESPVSTEKINDLNFGSFVVGSEKAAIDLSASVIHTTGDVKLQEGNCPVIASFMVSGGNSAFSVAVPQQALAVSRVGGSESMSVSSFSITTSPQVNSIADLISIGAVLNTSSFQPNGRYVAIEPLQVIICFN